MDITSVAGLIMVSSFGTGLLGLALAGYMATRARPVRVRRDVDEIVRNAPYSRLHNILPIDRTR